MPNHLQQETSPYLLQHKDNPVDWHPWGKEAIEKARAQDKPILLSIGYSACHWCHVMEHESFENIEIARLMNESFVNIKVDREERPDLDQIYQNVAQVMTQGGGWPLTVFLTPDLRPFYGGTYFPPEDRYGRPGFPRVLNALADAFRNSRQNVLENAEKLTDAIRTLESVAVPQDSEKSGSLPSKEEFRATGDRLLSLIDWENGGFGHAPKFPNTMSLSFLWRQGEKRAVIHSLERMAKGGIYDHLGGGFHRYSVDEGWQVPHFEKMLYDNAAFLKLYSEVLLSGESRDLFRYAVRDTVDYVIREMRSDSGGFYSTQDADTEGEEGKYFVWDPAEVRAAMSEDEARVFMLRYGVTEAGNFEHGKTVLYLARELTEFSDPEKALLESGKKKALIARDRREKPSLDDKVITSWNGLMISGFCWAGRALGDKDILKVAKDAFAFVLKNLSYGENRLHGTYQRGKAKFNGYLDDYAFMAMAALDLARVENDPVQVAKYIQHARDWTHVILTQFKSDDGTAGYYFTSQDHEKLIQRPKSVFDQSIPSGTSIALQCLAALAELDPDSKGAEYDAEFREQIMALFPACAEQPFGHGELLCAALLGVQGPVVVSGSGASDLFDHPNVFQKADPKTQGTPGLLICHQKTCSLPLRDLAQAKEKILEKVKL